LAALGYRVIAPDLRGHGRSAHDVSAQSYSLLSYVADLVGLLDRLELERVTLVGHSLGSLVAVFCASTFPKRIRDLVLVETILLAGVDNLDLRRAFRKDLELMMRAPEHVPMKDVDDAVALMCTLNPRLDPEFATQLCKRATRPVDGGVVWRWDAVLRTRVGLRFPGKQAQYLEMLRQIEAPVRLLFGNRSRFTRDEEVQQLGSAFPSASRQYVDGGHNLHFENPQAIVRAVLAFP
jgi:pimeloyl-ACP methyl ester carboxylesterase